MSDTFGAKVEASTEDQVIRITSDYETSIDIMKLIMHTLDNIKLSRVEAPVNLIPAPRAQNPQKPFFFANIRQVMQHTNTVIRYVFRYLSSSSQTRKDTVRLMIILRNTLTDLEIVDDILSWTR